MEETTYTDPATGLVHTRGTVIRRQPASEAVVPADAEARCREIVGADGESGLQETDASVLAGCTFVSSETKTDYDTVSYG